MQLKNLVIYLFIYGEISTVRVALPMEILWYISILYFTLEFYGEKRKGKGKGNTIMKTIPLKEKRRRLSVS